MKRVFAFLVVAALSGGSVMAGEWTGTYAGFSLGRTEFDGPGLLDGDNTAYGLHFGYDFDAGDVVLGAEVEFDPSNITLGGAAVVEDTGRLKVKTGYDFGPALGYVILGGARVATSAGSDTGFLYGLGVAIDLGNGFTLSGEGLRHEFSNFKGLGVDLDANSVALRASFRF